MAELVDVLADLAAEGADLEKMVTGLDSTGWQTPTPAAGWTIAHQIGHLAWTDDIAYVSATDPELFMQRLQEAIAAGDIDKYVDNEATAWAAKPDLLQVWQDGRDKLVEALKNVPAGTKLTWFGPPMSAMSMATARMMETWAHGQDVFDALGITREPTDRLKHVTHLAVRTRNFAYLVRGETAPAAEFRIELAAPSGEVWSWGPEDSADKLTGSALDFCLLATQRRHRLDTDLVASTDAVEHWLSIAQVFAGPPGEGRQPGQFS
ncbi:TIGR03084 family metal-binding protein [Smaragdicoccus niigatensis]|uniref:TIGR03084 family metal-binding protein n=1 Tax=Smaragdicoccus niigatensis TaxID=359359 RepID=UPI000376408F|nr:TIGR03084 family metal-binding protein [Smaragdicoccus niigatensis]